MLNMVMNIVFLSYKTEEGYTTCTVFYAWWASLLRPGSWGPRFCYYCVADTLLENTNAYYMLNNHLEGWISNLASINLHKTS